MTAGFVQWCKSAIPDAGQCINYDEMVNWNCFQLYSSCLIHLPSSVLAMMISNLVHETTNRILVPSDPQPRVQLILQASLFLIPCVLQLLSLGTPSLPSPSLFSYASRFISTFLTSLSYPPVLCCSSVKIKPPFSFLVCSSPLDPRRILIVAPSKLILPFF